MHQKRAEAEADLSACETSPWLREASGRTAQAAATMMPRAKSLDHVRDASRSKNFKSETRVRPHSLQLYAQRTSLIRVRKVSPIEIQLTMLFVAQDSQDRDMRPH